MGQGVAGFDCELKVGGVTAGKAQNVDITTSRGVIVTTTRDSNGWRSIIPGVAQWNISNDQLWIPSNAALSALLTAYWARAQVAIEALDADGYGFSGNAYVTELKRGEPLEDGVTCSITLEGDGALVRVTPGS